LGANSDLGLYSTFFIVTEKVGAELAHYWKNVRVIVKPEPLSYQDVLLPSQCRVEPA
jgi:hypothetical protein